MPFSATHPLIKELIERLGLPDHCIEIKITARVGEAVTVDCTFYPDAPAEDAGQAQRKHYRLEEI